MPRVISMGSRARGALGEIPGRGSRFGHSGHVVTRATSGETLPAVVLGTRVALAGFRGKYHSLDFAAHSGASGRLAAHSEASGGSITRWTSRRTRELPGGLRRTRRLPGLALGFGTRGHVSCSEGYSEGVSKGLSGWLSGHVAFSESFRRRFRRRLRRGHSAWLRDSFERVFGARGTLRRAPKGGASGWHVPKGVFERVSERVLRAGF